MKPDYTIIIKGGYLDITIDGKKTNLLYSLAKEDKVQILNSCANLIQAVTSCMYTLEEKIQDNEKYE